MKNKFNQDKGKQKALKQNKSKQTLSEEQAEIERLRQENTYLQIENLYLKKLKELGLSDPRDSNRPNSQ